jgi:hypothetical protein
MGWFTSDKKPEAVAPVVQAAAPAPEPAPAQVPVPNVQEQLREDIFPKLERILTLFKEIKESNDHAGVKLQEVASLLEDSTQHVKALTPAPVPVAPAVEGQQGGRKPGKKTKKGGFAPLNMEFMGASIMNTSALMKNDPSVFMAPKPWEGPIPFSSGATIPNTLTSGLSDNLRNVMDPTAIKGGAKKTAKGVKPTKRK